MEELRRADDEIEESFTLTQEDLNFSRGLDREAKLDKLDNRGKKIAAQQAAYREANKEKIAAQQAAWKKENREKWNAYQREYRRRREMQKKAASRRCSAGKRNMDYDNPILH